MKPSSTPFVITGLVLIALALVANEWVLGQWVTEAGRVTNPGTRLVIAAFDLGALAAGLVLVVRRHRAPWREMLLMAGAVIVAVGLLEVGLRVWFAVRTSMSPQEREIAATIGWRPVANASFEIDVPGFGTVRYSTTRGGFRVFGDTGTSKPKVLVIGDSYTEAAMVSDGETYYQRLATARPDLEWFAIGGGGYGTLQEFMLLDEWVDVVRPSMVLLQLHPNDLINNSHALESRSTTNNNQMTRPYWDEGRVVSRFPENEAWGPLYNLVRHSYALRLFNVNLHALRSRSADSAERTLTREDSDVSRAIDTTVALLEKLRMRAGVPVSAFSVKPDAWFSFWSESDACRRAGVEFIPGVGEAVDAAAAAGERVTGAPVDAHWNGQGHAIAARMVEPWLARKWPVRQPSP